MKKLVSLIIALAVALSLTGAAFAEEPVTITYATFSASGAQEETLKKMVEVFEEKNPDIKVDVQLTGYDDYFTKLATTVGGGNAPDVFEMNMENFLAYMLRGACADLTGLVDPASYSEGTLSAVSSDGKLYAVPMSFSTCVLFYNKALFDQAGIDYPDDTWTWTEAQAAAEKIRALGDDIWGYYQPISYNEFYKSVKGNGGSLLNEDYTTFTVNTPENVAVLEAMLARVRGEDRVMPNAEDMAGRGDWDLFSEGKLGMLVSGIWGFQTFTDQCDFDWDITVEPGFKYKSTFFFANVNCVSTESDKQEAAARFVDAMGSDPDIVQLRLDASWELPTIADQTKLTQYLEVTPPDNREAVFDSMDYAVAPPALLEQGAVSEIIGNVLGTLETNDMTAQEALDEIQAQLEEADLL
ncbi:MAG: sugar ABC transporter substrate-binding protein [Christensenellaceae bacterium]|nr:sugar ABC transporter substrate-binding protein [Christensenellaceae bacterium]